MKKYIKIIFNNKIILSALVILVVIFYFNTILLITKTKRSKVPVESVKNFYATKFENLWTRSVLSSKCSCRPEKVVLDEYENYYEVRVQLNRTIINSYKIHKKKFNAITCDVYNVLRRGPNKKVIGYSLYGQNLKYYNHIDEAIQLADQIYPDWIVRIHYNDTILTRFICILECLKNKNGSYYDNTDFCDMNRLPNSLVDKSDTWNASYMHAMKWRWFPIADSFVDYFVSRDTDAWVIQREVDSVNVWLNSNTLFHVMRDHPQHHIPILGGLWGYANVRNRTQANYLFSLMKNTTIADVYYEGSRKGRDQHFLNDYFYKYARLNGTIHDSFHCKIFNDSTAFPTKRSKFDCYLSCYYCCDEKYTKKLWKNECPIECRPPDHKDWMYC